MDVMAYGELKLFAGSFLANIEETWTNFIANFSKTFLEEGRWKTFLEGFGNTLLIALFATLIGVIIGTLVGVVRVYHAQTKRLKILDAVCRIYVSIIRGTPVIVQLMILYYLVFVSVKRDQAWLVATLGFGLNSGAYVSEIIRGGILSIDIGQTEAGRSLGFSQAKTMWYIVLPQGLKNALPALGNEFIVLIKETSIAGQLAVTDLTRAADIVRSQTWEAFFPLISIAVIYWVIVTGLTAGLARIERRLAKSDRS